jgi:hypothetical protein
MPRPTGIPTHVKIQAQIDEVLKCNDEFLQLLHNQTTRIQESVKQAIEENDVTSNLVTLPTLRQHLDEYNNKLVEFINKNINIAATGGRPGGLLCDGYNDFANHNNGELVDCVVLDAAPGLQEGPDKFACYCYVSDEKKDRGILQSQFWDVPKGWSFGDLPNRKIGWTMWLKGNQGNIQVVNGVRKRAPIKPFRLFVHGRLPSKNLQNVYRSSWKGIYDEMMQCPTLQIPDKISDITAAIIDSSFLEATEYLQSIVSYIWLKNVDLDGWSISTWSKFLTYQ